MPELAALTQPILPYYQLTAAPTQMAAMLPAAAGGSRADKLEVSSVLTVYTVFLRFFCYFSYNIDVFRFIQS